MRNYLITLLGLLQSFSLAGVVVFGILILFHMFTNNYNDYAFLGYVSFIIISLVVLVVVSLPLRLLIKKNLEIKRFLKSYLINTQIVSVLFALLFGLLIYLSDNGSLSEASIDLIFFAAFCFFTFGYAYFGFLLFKRVFNSGTANVLGFIYLVLSVSLIFFGLVTHWEFGIS